MSNKFNSAKFVSVAEVSILKYYYRIICINLSFIILKQNIYIFIVHKYSLLYKRRTIHVNVHSNNNFKTYLFYVIKILSHQRRGYINILKH